MPYVRTRLGRLFYDDRGTSKGPDQPAIVLLHGMLYDRGMWRGVLEPLTELGRVVLLDGPGHGRSEAPPRFTLEDHADALVDVFAELKIRRAVLGGVSWGSMVALRMAIQHPDHVRALALIAGSGDAETTQNKVKYRLFVAFARRFGLPRAFVEREIAPLMFCDRTLATRPELVDDLHRSANSWDRDAAARAALAVVVHRKSVATRLPSIRVPTLVVHGREDRSLPLARSEAIASAVPGARLVVVEDAGHMCLLERPGAVADAFIPFVRENVSTAR